MPWSLIRKNDMEKLTETVCVCLQKPKLRQQTLDFLQYTLYHLYHEDRRIESLCCRMKNTMRLQNLQRATANQNSQKASEYW